jgi:hypothetical protein
MLPGERFGAEVTVATNERYDRNVRFFGEQGQERIHETGVAVVGLGGLGSHVVQQLALLGVPRLSLIDSEELAKTDLNRNVCARADDPIPGSRKTDLCERAALSINPDIQVTKVHDSLVSEDAFASIISSNYVFGCLDSDGARLILNELCSAYARPYVDLASDIPPGERLRYGGRICFATGLGCLVCLDQIDLDEARRELGGLEFRKAQEELYGVSRDLLGEVGPAVVSINGTIASIAVTEFALAVSELRSPHRVLKYYGHFGKVCVNNDEPHADCYYCLQLRGRKHEADLERYIREGVGAYLR